MALRLRAAGIPLIVSDVRPEACAAAIAAGAHDAPNAADCAREATIVITCVPGPPEAEAAILGADGVLAGAQPGTIVLEMSTIDVALSKRLSAACAERGVRYVDAPISGGADGARDGTLCVMAGGDPSTLADAKPVLDILADRVVHVGPTGAGHFTKAINQIVYLGYVALFCEATGAADAYGIPRDALIDVLRHSAGGSPLQTHWEERLLTSDITPGFAIQRVLKDLYAGAAAYADLSYDGSMFAAALSAFEAAAARGHAADDMTAVIRP